MIITEGNIGSGKTKLTQKIKEAYNIKSYFEPVAENPILEHYYQDPKRYGYLMQNWLLTERYQMHQSAVQYEWTQRQETVFDRSIYGDMVFALTNYEMGNMSDIEYASYMQTRELMLKTCLVPQVCIFLNVRIEQIIENIKTRGRDCEKNIPIEYLRLLNKNYHAMLADLRKRGSKILIWDNDEFQAVDRIHELEPYVLKKSVENTK